jgi:nucleoside phosphorylase
LSKGDVVISDVIHGYEYGKVEADFWPRDDWTYKTDLGLLTGALEFALRPDWQSRIQIQPPLGCSPKIVKGEVASGDKVIDNPTNDFFKAVLEHWPKVVAVEMEGAGVGAAIEQAQALGHAPGFMMIRGISDVPRPPREGETRGTSERDN